MSSPGAAPPRDLAGHRQLPDSRWTEVSREVLRRHRCQVLWPGRIRGPVVCRAPPKAFSFRSGLGVFTSSRGWIACPTSLCQRVSQSAKPGFPCLFPSVLF